MGSKGSNTTTTTSGPPQYINDAYQQTIARAQQNAQAPYQKYNGELVAGLTPDQQSAFGTINGLQGVAQPYINQAAQYAQQGAAPVGNISGGDISQYLNPYQSAVTNATMANINETNAQQQQQLVGNAALQGALGGDRVGVAQAELARQQNLTNNSTLANLNQQNYQTALTTAQQQQQNQQVNAQRAGQAAYTYGSLGQEALGAGLTGAQAQLQSGTIQQQQQQATDASKYQQFQLQQAFPYQQTQWLAGLESGLGSSAGGTSQTTGPAPNQTGQILGGGLAGLGLLGQSGAFGGAGWLTGLMAFSDERMKENIHEVGRTNDGQPIYRYNFKGSPKTEIGLIAQDVEKSHPESVGEVGGMKAVDYDSATRDSVRGYADGGMPTPYVGGLGSAGYIPANQIVHGSGPPRPPQTQTQAQPSAMGMMSDALKIGKAMKGSFNSQGSNGLATDAPDNGSGIYTGPAWQPGFGGGADTGGGFGLDGVYAGGGLVRGYDGGGDVTPSFNDRWTPAVDAVNSGDFDPQGANNLPQSAMSTQPPDQLNSPVPVQTVSYTQPPAPTQNEPIAGSTSPTALNPSGGTSSSDDDDIDFSDTGSPNIGLAGAESSDDDTVAGGSGNDKVANSGPSNNFYSALTTAGLAMLASKSPFLGNTIGEGGLAGIKGYADLKKADLNQKNIESEIERRAEQSGIQRDAIKMRMEQLKQQLQLHQQQLGIQQGRLDVARDSLGKQMTAGYGPDPNDPTKTVAGVYMYDPTTHQPVFHAGVQTVQTVKAEETNRHNVATEGSTADKNKETNRHNVATETTARAKVESKLIPGEDVDPAHPDGPKVPGVYRYDIESNGLKFTPGITTLDRQKFEEQKRENLAKDDSRLQNVASKIQSGQGMNPETGELVDGAYQYNPQTHGWDFNPGVVLTQKGAGLNGRMTPDTINFLADQAIAGDNSVFTNLGRGQQSAANILAIREAIARKMLASGKGGNDMAAVRANFMANAAAARTLANREAGVTSSVLEAEGTFPLALEASDAVPRGKFVPWNQMVQMAKKGFSDPALARFWTANQAVITAYGQAMSRTGVNTVDARHSAQELLSTVTGQESYEGVLKQMDKEMRIAENAPKKARAEVLARISGKTYPEESSPLEKTLDERAKARQQSGNAQSAAEKPRPRKTQNGHTFEQQPDGNWKFIQ